MTEQTPTPEIDTDDVEGHALSRRDMAHLRRDVPADLAPGGADVDDVAGHLAKSGRAPADPAAEDDGDVEGHGARPRI